jgi:hypothetical protein
VKEKV